METSSRRLIAVRGVVLLFGLILIAATVGTAFTDTGNLAVTLVEATPTIVLSVALIYVGYQFLTDSYGFAAADLRLIYAWAGISIVAVTILGAWVVLLRVLLDHPGTHFLALTVIAAGGTGGIVVGMYNVREKQQSYEARQLRRTIDEVPDGVAVVGEDDTIKYMNQAGAALHGYDPDELLGEPWTVLYPSSTIESAELAEAEEILDETDSWRGEVRGQRRNGDTFPMEINLRRLESGAVVGVHRDITERKRNERQIRALQEAAIDLQRANSREEVGETTTTIAQNILQRPLAALWTYDEDNELLRPAATNEASRPSDQGLSLEEFEPIAPGSPEMAAFEQDEPTEWDDYQQVEGRTYAESSIRSCLVAPIEDYALLSVASVDVEDFDDTDHYLMRILAQNAAAAYARVENEERLRVQNSRLEFLNSLLRHDVLNGMTVIRTRGDVLTEELTGTQQEYAETIVEWSDNITSLIGRVRTLLNVLAGEREAEMHPVEVTSLLERESARIQGAFPSLTVELSLSDSLHVLGNDLLADVLGNLIRNAVEHNDSDQPYVSISAEPVDDHVQIRVADNGPGVPDDARDRVFRRGETAHAKSTGSGFGLFFVNTMIEQYGGEIWIEDNEPRGSVFVVELPAPGREDEQVSE